MKKVICILICLVYFSAKAQIYEQSIVADTILNDEDGIYDFFVKKCIKLHDNTILLVRPYDKDSVEQYGSLIISRYNLSGNKIFSVNYVPDYKYTYIADVTQTTDGTILIATESNRETQFISFDSTGNFIASTSAAKTDTLYFIQKLKPTNNNKVIIIKQKFIFENSWSCFMYVGCQFSLSTSISKIDNTGVVEWEKELSVDKLYDYGDLNIDLLKHKLISDVDILDTPDNSFNIIKFTKDSIQEDLKIEYLHFNENGGILERKFLLENIYDNICTEDDGQFSLFNDHYEILYHHNNGSLYGRYIQYNYNRSGILTDSINITDNDMGNYKISVFNQSHYYLMHKTLLKLQNNFYYSNYATPSSINNRLYDIHLRKFLFEWQATASKPGYPVEDLALISVNDSTLLHINIEDSIYHSVYTRTKLVFHYFSIKDNQIVYTAYIDRNLNGIYDNTDTTFINADIEIEDNHQIQNYPLALHNGHHSHFVKTGTFISKLVSYEQYLTYYTVSPSADTTVFTGLRQTDSVFFRLIPKPDIRDLQISIIPTAAARPGFNATYKIIAKNVGTKTVNNISVKFLKDSFQTIEQTSIAPNNIVDDTLIWNIDSMTIYDSREFNVICKNASPPTLDANDTMILFALIAPFQNDTALKDNFFTLVQPVVNSFDPNDKLESHGAGITTQQLADRDYLYYTIRFQNTGTASAVNVVVKDTLDETLDWSSFEMLKASHVYRMTVNNRRNITWTFNNIYLADSTTNEPNSHGYVSFRIKPVANLLPTDVIENRAHIFFDYNEAVITNTVTTRIVEQRATNIQQKEVKQIKLYPSPTSDMVQLEFNVLSHQNLQLKIVDVNGNELRNESLKQNTGFNTVSINLGDYANGIYFIQLNDNNGNLYYGKVLKQ